MSHLAVLIGEQPQKPEPTPDPDGWDKKLDEQDIEELISSPREKIWRLMSRWLVKQNLTSKDCKFLPKSVLQIVSNRDMIEKFVDDKKLARRVFEE